MSFKDKVTHKKGGKHEFRTAHMDSLLYFYHQKYRTFLPQQNATMPRARIWIRSLTLTDIKVTPKAVQDKLSKLNPNKAQGPDQALVNNGLCHCVFFSTNP